MLNFFVINLTLPGGVANVAEFVAEPGYMGNILVLLFALVMVGLYGFFLERHQVVIALFATYTGFLLANFFPSNVWDIGDWIDSWWGRLVIFIVSLLLTALILSKTYILRSRYTTNFIVRWYQAFVSGVLYTGLLTSIILVILPANILRQFSPWFLDLFISDTARFLWFLLPVLGLLFMRSKRRRPGRPAY